MTKEETLKAIAVMQAFADGKQIAVHCFRDEGWYLLRPDDTPNWDWARNEYRIELEKPSIDWSHVAPEYRFLAVDDDEHGHLYQNKPFNRAGDWEDPTNRKIYAPRASTFASYKCGDCHWRDSLVERPEGV
ncbi:hypothetical protein F406_gp064 [Agrobacterium phage 7-7-1]|uniref:Uncharacterized protein n=1 Tax=Agrobacterium phage 7-7-1 TaxID=1161931 RepID=J7FAE8_9CAUD|nr:hypothetical protein F406_gp064 [Agrobacterium phage 7-7-1]AFH19751.1 hypothetical protein 7-7-1_00053 [Agrobacterium phage 7-7-1]